MTSVLNVVVKRDREYYVVSFKCMCGFIIEVVLQQLKDTDGLIDINNIRITTDKIMQHIEESHHDQYAYEILEQIIYDLIKGVLKTRNNDNDNLKWFVMHEKGKEANNKIAGGDSL